MQLVTVDFWTTYRPIYGKNQFDLTSVGNDRVMKHARSQEFPPQAARTDKKID
jgi:hypothetical protein